MVVLYKPYVAQFVVALKKNSNLRMGLRSVGWGRGSGQATGLWFQKCYHAFGLKVKLLPLNYETMIIASTYL